MAVARLTTRGQVTIPKKIRESLKLRTGDKIEIVVTSDSSAVLRPVSKKVDDVFCKLHKPGRKAVSIDAMNAAIKEKNKYSLSQECAFINIFLKLFPKFFETIKSG